MKKLFVCIIMMMCLCVNNSSAQTIVREGNTFKSVRAAHKKDTIVTKFIYETGGVKYPIIINKNGGSCYIWKKKKDGTVYPMYMKPEVSQQVADAMNIVYKPRKRK